ncbi:hypothetical protein FGO68_gene11893 [Halteria grandinella]|uniref:Uncharacterized protein n=1 Tax=Halteria grandinella TaxID=5974 RepID=A0A8J8T2G1_HALGN|nr:hypothetical protein FGO68_gene11893 [Halteria grandinella]
MNEEITNRHDQQISNQLDPSLFLACANSSHSQAISSPPISPRKSKIGLNEQEIVLVGEIPFECSASQIQSATIFQRSFASSPSQEHVSTPRAIAFKTDVSPQRVTESLPDPRSAEQPIAQNSLQKMDINDEDAPMQISTLPSTFQEKNAQFEISQNLELRTQEGNAQKRPIYKESLGARIQVLSLEVESNRSDQSENSTLQDSENIGLQHIQKEKIFALKNFERQKVGRKITKFNAGIKNPSVLMKAIMRLFKKIVTKEIIDNSSSVQIQLQEALGKTHYANLQFDLFKAESLYKDYLPKDQIIEAIQKITVVQALFYRYNKEALIDCLCDHSFRTALLLTLPHITYALYISNHQKKVQCLDQHEFAKKHSRLIGICKYVDRLAKK